MIFYHISWDFIYLKINPCAVSVHFVSGRTDFYFTIFFLVLDKRRPGFIKRFTQSHRAKAESQVWTQRPPLWWEEVSAGRWQPFAQQRVTVSYLPIISGERLSRGDDVLVSHLQSITQRLTYLSNSVLPYQGPLTPSDQLLCNSRKNHFLFHRCLSMA